VVLHGTAMQWWMVLWQCQIGSVVWLHHLALSFGSVVWPFCVLASARCVGYCADDNAVMAAFEKIWWCYQQALWVLLTNLLIAL